MNILLTRTGYLMVDNDCEYLLTDENCLNMMKDATLRNAFLEAIGETTVVIGRLGKQIKPNMYKKKEITVKEADNGHFKKEVGYFAKL
ncbi:hypothetical protein UT300012_23020 [Paraclostridium bifermentans]